MATYYTRIKDQPKQAMSSLPILGSTRIIDLTVEQLQQVIASALQPREPHPETTNQTEQVYGLKGLAEILGCCRSQAQKIKNSGKYRQAISQEGRKIIVNKTLLLQLIPHA